MSDPAEQEQPTDAEEPGWHRKAHLASAELVQQLRTSLLELGLIDENSKAKGYPE